MKRKSKGVKGEKRASLNGLRNSVGGTWGIIPCPVETVRRT